MSSTLSIGSNHIHNLGNLWHSLLPNLSKSCPNELKFSEEILLVDYHKLCKNQDHWNILTHAALFEKAFFGKFETDFFLAVFTSPSCHPTTHSAPVSVKWVKEVPFLNKIYKIYFIWKIYYHSIYLWHALKKVFFLLF